MVCAQLPCAFRKRRALVLVSAVVQDGLAGWPLKPDPVRAARRKELEYFDRNRVWTLRPRTEVNEKLRKPPTAVKLADVNKGDGENPNPEPTGCLQNSPTT